MSRTLILAVAAGLVIAGPAFAQSAAKPAGQNKATTASVASAKPPSIPLIAQACAGCHGQNGAGKGGTPKLAGVNREQFLKLWGEFRGNERPNTIMNRISRGYTDTEVATLADYFSTIK
jgi:sulfide dehydrogenase cytochrome subunit